MLWLHDVHQWLNGVQVAQAVRLDALGAVDAWLVRRDVLERQMAV